MTHPKKPEVETSTTAIIRDFIRPYVSDTLGRCGRRRRMGGMIGRMRRRRKRSFKKIQ